MPILNIRDAGGGAMKQPEDTRTAELPGLDVPAKRGRGRPRKADALTPAQRAQRYRWRQIARQAQGAPWGGKEWSRAMDALENLEAVEPAAPKPAPVKHSAPAIKYRGPAGETWTGRGLRPRWVSAALENGYTLAQLEAWARNGFT